MSAQDLRASHFIGMDQDKYPGGGGGWTRWVRNLEWRDLLGTKLDANS